MNTKSYSQLYTSMKNNMIANQDQITDFNEGSIISTIFESIARIAERMYIDTRNGYSNNLKAIPYSVFNFTRKEGAKATAVVKFNRSTAISTRTVIPVGTQISTGTYFYSTTSVGYIDANEKESNNVSVIAEKVGVVYNVAAHSITTIESAVSSDVVAVDNALRASGGTDDETDLQMLSRFKTYINGLQGTNTYGFKSTVLSIEGVRSVAIVEEFPPLNNIYNAIVYVDDGTGNLTDELKLKIEDAINGNDTQVKPGCRATGMQVLVSPSMPVNVNIAVTVQVYRTDPETAEFDVKESLVDEINNLTIGENIIISSLILKLRRISYVRDVTNLSITDGKGEQQTTNFELEEYQIARISADNITVTVQSA